jgi:hypothetical protein
MFNGIDYVILLSFLGIIGLGFLSGVTRVSAAILAIYFGSVFATAFYRITTDQVRHYVSTMSARTGYLFFFVLLFSFSSVFMTIMLSRWLGNVQLPRRFEIADNVGGAALGVIVSGMAITLAAMLLSILLQAVNQTFQSGGGDSIVSWVHFQITDSSLVPVFLRMAPFFLRFISPWFPGGLPPILSAVPRG